MSPHTNSHGAGRPPTLTEQVAELRERLERVESRKDAPKKKRPTKRVPEPVARGSRTTAQAALAVVVASWLNPILLDNGIHVVEGQKAWLIGLLTALFSLALTWIEDRFGFSVLRPTPQTPPSPVVDN